MPADPKPKSVLIIVENLPVPRDRRVWQEARALAAAGWQVSVICPRSRAWPERHEVLEGIHIYRHPLPHEAHGAIGYLLEYAVALFWEFTLAWKVLFTRGFDVIHACNPPDLIFLVGGFFKLFFGKAFLFDQHDPCPELYVAKFGRKDFLYRMVRWCERMTYRTADVVIATNATIARFAAERGAKAPEDVFVVRSAPDPNRIKVMPVDPAWRQGRQAMVGYVGVLNAQDGVDLLLEAARYVVVESGRNVQFVVLGDGPELKRLKRMAVRLGVGDHVTFPGWADDSMVFSMLSSADVCVCPDPSNPFNDACSMNKVVEYMALGVPLVQFDLPEGRGSAGDAAVYARANDARDLGRKVVGLLDDEPLRKRLSQMGKERMDAELSWTRQVPKLLAAYEAVDLKRTARTGARRLRWRL